MNKEYEVPFDEQASLERLEALGKQDRVVIEKRMTDVSESVNNIVLNLTDSIQELESSNSRMDIKSWGHEEGIIISGNEARIIVQALSEARKGMFTEELVREYLRSERIIRTEIQADFTRVMMNYPKWLAEREKWLTERKGRG